MRRAERVMGGLVLALCAGCATETAAPRSGMDTAGGVPFDVEHYAIALDIDPARRAIEAGCTIRLWPASEPAARRDDPVTVVDLSLDGFDIRSVTDAAGRALVWSRD